MKCSPLMTLAFVPFLAAASCQTIPTATAPCDLLVPIPDAPPHVNRILVTDARPTAQGIAMHRQRVVRYGCAK